MRLVSYRGFLQSALHGLAVGLVVGLADSSVLQQGGDALVGVPFLATETGDPSQKRKKQTLELQV